VLSTNCGDGIGQGAGPLPIGSVSGTVPPGVRVPLRLPFD
jgi:hypothetical protein